MQPLLLLPLNKMKLAMDHQFNKIQVILKLSLLFLLKRSSSAERIKHLLSVFIGLLRCIKRYLI